MGRAAPADALCGASGWVVRRQRMRCAGAADGLCGASGWLAARPLLSELPYTVGSLIKTLRNHFG